MNHAWNQIAASSSTDGPVKGSPSWMVIPRVLVVVGSFLLLSVYPRKGKTSGFEEESPQILVGFGVSSSSDSSTSSSSLSWKQAHVSHMKACG